MPTILDSLFHMVVDTTSTPIGVKGRGWWVAMEWQGFQLKKFNMPNNVNFKLYISQNVAKFMPSLINQSCGDFLPAVCLSRQDRAIYRPPEHLRASEKLKKKS